MSASRVQEAPTLLYTVADLAELPSVLPSGPVNWELDNGRIVPMSPPGNLHGAVESNLVIALGNQGQSRGLGKVRSGDVGVVLWRNPDRLVGADAVFIANRSLPIRVTPEGYLETIPDLVVEVVSKTDRPTSVNQKATDYLRAGVRVVWVADPARQTITEHRPGMEPRIWESDEALTVEDVIPGFCFRVADAFVE